MAQNNTSDNKNRSYSNNDITVHWKPSECIHVTTCYRELIDVFNPRKRPWINMEGASTEEIIRVVDLCPTNALTYEWNKEKKTEPVIDKMETHHNTTANDSAGAEIKVMKDGPLVIKGNYTITGSNGKPIKHMKVMSLCRCGHSDKMPYCDGTHRKVGFTGD